MRKLILNRIETLRKSDGGFRKGTMRWKNWVLTADGVVLSRIDGIPLEETTSENFANLSDDILLMSFETIYTAYFKQI